MPPKNKNDKTHPGWDNYPTPFVDYLKTKNARERTSGHVLGIYALTATASDTLEWYFSQDPINEERYIRAATMLGENGIDRERFIETLEHERFLTQTYEFAATNIISKVLYPEYFESETPDLVALKDRVAKESPTLNVGPTGELHTTAVLGHGLQVLVGKKVDAKDLRLLLFASEMMGYSSSYDERVVEAGKAIKPEEDIFEEIAKAYIRGYTEPNPKQLAIRTLAAGYTAEIAKKSRDLYFETSELDAAKVHIEAIRMLASFQLSTHNHNKDWQSTDRQISALRLLIETARDFFTGPDALQRKFKGDPSVVGKLLHEFMWFLDMSMLLQAETENGIIVVPSINAQDAPEVNYPEMRRGFDFFVHVDKGQFDWFTYPLQVKSSSNPHYAKEYHPEIRQIGEPNFQDKNPRSLHSKLMKYTQFLIEAEIQGGFHHGVEPIRRQILASVLAEYDYIKNLKPEDVELGKAEHLREITSTYEQLFMRTHRPQVQSHSHGLNREQRRALAKQQKRERRT